MWSGKWVSSCVDHSKNASLTQSNASIAQTKASIVQSAKASIVQSNASIVQLNASIVQSNASNVQSNASNVQSNELNVSITQEHPRDIHDTREKLKKVCFFLFVSRLLLLQWQFFMLSGI